MLQDLTSKAQPPRRVVEGSGASLIFGTGLRWAALSSIGPRAVAMIGTLLLAALLTPRDFGYVAIVNLVVALAQSVFGAAFTPALVHLRGEVEDAALAAFWVAAGISVLIYLPVHLAAPAIEGYYGVPHLSGLLRVSALSIVANIIGAVPVGLLQRRRQFKQLSFVALSSQLAGTGLSVVLAFCGWGAWALVLGLVSSAFVSAVLAFVCAQWLPRLTFKLGDARPLIGFSFWVVLGGMQTWLFLSGDNAIASRFFDPATLGIYVLGFNLATMLSGLVVSVVSTVAYPTLCHVNRVAPAEFPSTFLDVQTVTAAVVFPIAALSAAMAEPIIGLLFRTVWADLGSIVKWLVILPGLCAVWSLNSDGYRAIGRPDIWPKISVVCLAVLLPCLAIAAPHGLHSFTITRSIAALPLPFLNMIVAVRVLRVPVRAQLSRLLPPAAAAGALFCVTTGLVSLVRPTALGPRICYLVICASAGLFVYLFVLRLTGPHVWKRLQESGRSLCSGGVVATTAQQPI